MKKYWLAFYVSNDDTLQIDCVLASSVKMAKMIVQREHGSIDHYVKISNQPLTKKNAY